MWNDINGFATLPRTILISVRDVPTKNNDWSKVVKLKEISDSRCINVSENRDTMIMAKKKKRKKNRDTMQQVRKILPLRIRYIELVLSYLNLYLLDCWCEILLCTNGSVTHFSEELKPRNPFDGTVVLLVSLKKDIFEQHVLPKCFGGVAPVWYLPNKLRWWS